MPRRRRPFFLFPIIIIAWMLVLGAIVMLLWNVVFPPVLHTEQISYWQAVALLALSRILFFGCKKRCGDHRSQTWRGDGSPWKQKWMNMNDEERAKFRDEWKRRCGRPGRNDNQ